MPERKDTRGGRRADSQTEPHPRTPANQTETSITPGITQARVPQLGSDYSLSTFERHAALLGDPRLANRMYARQRAEIMRQLQRDYGNRYVQRLVKHISRTRAEAAQAQSMVSPAEKEPGQNAYQASKRDPGTVRSTTPKPIQRKEQEEAELARMQAAIRIQDAIANSPGGFSAQREMYHPWEALLPREFRLRAFTSIAGTPATAVQPKLTVGPAGDQYEQEADQVAQEVTGVLSPPGPELAQRQDLDFEEELQTKGLEESQESLVASGIEPGIGRISPNRKEPALAQRNGGETVTEEDVEDVFYDALDHIPEVIDEVDNGAPLNTSSVTGALMGYLQSAGSYVVEGATGVVSTAANAAGQVLNYVQDKGTQTLKTHMAGLGFELTDEQARNMLSVALKQSQSLMVPVPAEELIISIDVNKLDRSFGDVDVTLDNISLQNVEWWVYNFVTWEGPTLKVGRLKIDSISVTRNADPTPVSLRASLDLNGLNVQASSNIMSLIASSAYLAMTAEGPPQEEIGDRLSELLATFKANLMQRVNEELTGQAGVQLDSLVVTVHEARQGNVNVSGGISGTDLALDLGVAGGLEGLDVSVGASGKVELYNAVVQLGEQSVVNVSAITLDVDNQGNGTADLSFVVHGRGIAEQFSNPVVRGFVNSLTKVNDPASLTVPINQYRVMLGGVAIRLPRHGRIERTIQSKLLDHIRVSNKRYTMTWRGRRQEEIEPELRVSAGPKRVKTVTAEEMGVTAEQQAENPVLIPKGTQEGGSQGAINLKAFVENVVQTRLRSLVAEAQSE